MRLQVIKNFIKLEAAGGIMLFIATLAALALSNSPLHAHYHDFIALPLFGKTLEFWVNDCLMAFFFLIVGIEIKREVLEGELNTPAKVALPCIAALGGMLVPSLFYALINLHDPVALRGWAIPSATDIAFSLAALSMLGKRIPLSIKVFLTALAIFDDLGAIVIIALFYAHELNLFYLSAAIITVAIAYVLGRLYSRLGLHNHTAIVLSILGTILWYFMEQSGVHATLTGVALAFALPLQNTSIPQKLHPWVTFGILPLFALMNVGISFAGFTPESLLHPVTLGIMCGLVLGKPVGIFCTSFITIKLGIAPMPSKARYAHLFGASIICGIGFTMSLFIGALAFEHASAPHLDTYVRAGVLFGSTLSALCGYFLLRIL